MTPGVPPSARLRAYLSGVIVTAGLCGVAYKAWALQVDDGAHYRELAARQHEAAVNIPAPRGDVVDAHGRPLAVSADADSVWANPREISDVTDTADKLARILGVEAGVLEDKLAADKKFVWLGRHVTHEVADAIRAAALPGVVVTKEPRRWYPGRTIAGPVIGRSDIDSRGVEGIELSMDGVLKGEHGSGTAVRDAHGRKMFADGLDQPDPGATVHLSLDRTIQEIADTAVADAVIKNQAKSGVAVVLDVKTSRVLAMSSYPTYDPNSNEPHGRARNEPVTDAFEAGSVMKVFTISAALEAGVVTPDTAFDVQSAQVGRKSFRDVHSETTLTTTGILKHSSNIGTVKIGLRLGKDRLYAGLKRFGFGAKTGIELPGEQTGRVRDGSTWRDIELATIAFGYGVTVTPLQVATALASIGNGGVYTEPRIVDRIVDPDGTLLYEAKPASRRVVSAKTAAQMRAMLAAVFEGGKDHGTAGAIVVPGFRCGGKTGTAHKYDHATHQYSPHRHLGSFIGLAPIDDPKIAIAVMIDEPTGGDYFGGQVAGPVFAIIASETLRYLGVPGLTLQCPVRPPGYSSRLDPTPKTCTIPAPKPSKTRATSPAEEPPAEDAEVDEAAPPPDTGAIMIPDFRGLGLAKALELARVAKLPVKTVGSGQVVDQEPAPGPFGGDAPGTITLRFSDGKSPSGARR
jgi:cell division protein FtsI (penicillin-binding protein 3)